MEILLIEDGPSEGSVVESILQSVDGPALVLEPEEGRILAASEAYLRETGTRREDIEGHTLFEVAGGDAAGDRAEGREALGGSFRRAVKTARAHSREMHPYPIQGAGALEEASDARAFRCLHAPVLGPGGDVRFVVHRLEDITHSEPTEPEARWSSRGFRDLADAMPLVVWTAEPDGEVDFFTEDLVEYTGVPREGMLGEAWLSIIHPHDRDRLVDAWSRSIETGEPYSVEARVRHREGRHRWHLIQAVPIRSGGEIVKWYGSAVEVHEQKQLQEEARDLARRLTRTLESVTDAFYVLDRDWRYLFLNREAERTVGLSRNELLGEKIWDVFPDLEGTEVEREYRRAMETGEMAVFEYYHPAFDRWSSIRAYPSAEALAIYSRDVTMERRAEQRVRESEERFRLVARATSDVIWDWDLRTDEAWWSEGMETLFGHSLDSLEPDSDSWTNRIHPADRERVVGGIRRSIESSDETWSDRYRFAKADGSYAQVLDRGFVIRDDEGRAIRMVGGMSDETEHREALRQLEEQAALLEKARDAIIVRELDHTVVYWNPSAEEIFGWSAEEALGRTMDELVKRDPEGFREAMTQVLEEGEWAGEMQKVRKDGIPVVVEARWTLLRDEEGRPQRILSIDTDITEKQKLMAQFLRAQRMESIGTLAGGIAHDLNNILAPILMSIGLLREEVEAEELQETLETIEVSAQRGADLVRQVLSFSRGVEGSRVPVDLIRIVDDLDRVVRDTFSKRIYFERHLPEDLWRVRGDPTQIHQVLMNLVVNARDAMSDGGTLEVSAENVELDPHYVVMREDVEPGPYVRISVSDNGAGIPKEILGQIFDPFFTTKEVGKGTGLGLSTVAAIVDSHGGFVDVYSEERKGTTFKLHLPASRGDVEERDERPEPELKRGDGELVLVVDDEASVRDITRQTLKSFGYRVVTASDGAEAVGIYGKRKEEIDVVLTDMTMPIMDGSATIRALKKLNPKVRIIAASGLGANEGVGRAADMGVTHFLPKPYTAETLLRMLYSVIHDAG